ncbi:diguanylate cyclase [Thermanaeromonas toyohensis]|uniref:diguanylate cyclase n=1 Tax=Thermanaeromonas toyohensis TaxID=161154 RepID=UPI000A03C5AF
MYFPNELKFVAYATKLVSYVVLNLDNMKQINDTLGYQVGDEVLRARASLPS